MENNQTSGSPEESLKAHSHEFRKELIPIQDHIYFASGFGASNSILIEGESASVLIDTLESLKGAEALKEAYDKVSSQSIKTIIYTHSHQDHVGGTSAFCGDGPDIISRRPFSDLLGPNAVSAILGKRAKRQFGMSLSSEERLNIGLGPGETDLRGMGEGFVPPTKQFSEEKLSLTVAGIHLELIAAPGETDDQLFVWLPDEKVLISGDNYYKSFPNLYAIRGTPYRDIAVWVESLNKMIALEPQYLLPGHSRPIIGRDAIKEVLTNYRDAINFVLQETLKYINQGLTPDELVQAVKLPPQLAEKPYLQEFYGTVEWSVRSIFTGYLGWFDGNPTNLSPLPPQHEAVKIAELAGGSEKLYHQAQNSLAQEDYQWCMQLADYLLALGEYVQAAKGMKIQACRALARRQISAAGRNYYFTCAQELESDLRIG